MKKSTLFFLIFEVITFAACSKKPAEGKIIYQLAYRLPDSLRNYGAYLPTTATVYFKGDSTVTIQGSEEESTTMIIYKPSAYMVGLLKSGTKRYQVNYNKTDQQKELPDMSVYQFVKGKGAKIIASYSALQYVMKNKFSGDTISTWFTKDVNLPQNFLTMPFNPVLGIPLSFSSNQNGFITKTSVKEIKFEPVPAGIFIVPAGYQKITPQQLSEMPVNN